VEINNSARVSGHEVRLRGPQPLVDRVLELGGLASVFISMTTGQLRIHAQVIERTGQDRHDRGAHRSAVRTVRAVVVTLPGRHCADDEPQRNNGAEEPCRSGRPLVRSSFTSPWGIPVPVGLLGGIVGLTRVDWAGRLARHDHRPGEGQSRASAK
jgi:hypothetical protein